MCELIDAIVQYHQSIKGSLFVTGFTLGSFLFSMKSVIVKTMKEEIYDQEDYQNDIDELDDIGVKSKYYGTLEKFSDLIFWAIALSFLSAITNITLGFFSNIWTASICLVSTFSAWFYIGKALYHFQSNWSKVFEYAENKARLKRKNIDKKK